MNAASTKIQTGELPAVPQLMPIVPAIPIVIPLNNENVEVINLTAEYAPCVNESQDVPDVVEVSSVLFFNSCVVEYVVFIVL